MKSLNDRDTNTATAKRLLRHGSIRNGGLVCVLNGSGWGGEIMTFEKQQSELVLLNQISKDQLAKVVVELIKDSRELRRAILEVVWNCPNIVTRV